MCAESMAGSLSNFSSISFCSFFFLMNRRPPRSTQDRSSAASDVYKGQMSSRAPAGRKSAARSKRVCGGSACSTRSPTVSYTPLRAHETVLDLVCSLLLEKNPYARNNPRGITLTTHTITNIACVLAYTAHIGRQDREPEHTNRT